MELILKLRWSIILCEQWIKKLLARTSKGRPAENYYRVWSSAERFNPFYTSPARPSLPELHQNRALVSGDQSRIKQEKIETKTKLKDEWMWKMKTLASSSGVRRDERVVSVDVKARKHITNLKSERYPYLEFFFSL